MRLVSVARSNSEGAVTDNAEDSVRQQLQKMVGREGAAFQDTWRAVLSGQARSEDLLAPSGRRYRLDRAPEQGLSYRLTVEDIDGTWTRATSFVAGSERPIDFPTGGPFVRDMTVFLSENSERPGETLYVIGEPESHLDMSKNGVAGRVPGQRGLADVSAQLRGKKGTPEMDEFEEVVRQYGSVGDTGVRNDMKNPEWRDRAAGLLSAIGVDFAAVARSLMPDSERVEEARRIARVVLEQSMARGWHVDHEQLGTEPLGVDVWRLTSSGTLRDITLARLLLEPIVMVRDQLGGVNR